MTGRFEIRIEYNKSGVVVDSTASDEEEKGGYESDDEYVAWQSYIDDDDDDLEILFLAEDSKNIDEEKPKPEEIFRRRPVHPRLWLLREIAKRQAKFACGGGTFKSIYVYKSMGNVPCILNEKYGVENKNDKK